MTTHCSTHNYRKHDCIDSVVLFLLDGSLYGQSRNTIDSMVQQAEEANGGETAVPLGFV